MVQYDFDESYGGGGNITGAGYGASGDNSVTCSYMQNNWTQIAETTLPLKTSKLAAANHGQFQASIEIRSKQISNKVIVVNLISLLVNLLLAIVAFYFSFINDSTSTTAFAADCVLDFISSAIVLWRYHGDLNSVYMHAREQIACIYLGALFELSSVGIIIKAVIDMTSDGNLDIEPESVGSSELVYLAIVATVSCSVMTVFKFALYRTIRDNSILLDVINTLISTVFALSIVMSQVLINVNPSFWYLDPILSIVLALFMMGFGIKVIHQNFNILKPIYYNQGGAFSDRSYNNQDQTSALIPMGLPNKKKQHLAHFAADQNSNYGINLNLPVVDRSRTGTWQKTDYSTIIFI